MSVNKFLPHLHILREDDANRQLANGFILNQAVMTQRIQVLVEAGGWTRALDEFSSDLIRGMEACANRFTILLIDFDGREGRLTTARAKIPAHLRDRVFVLGVWTEPEDLKRAGLGTYEEIGQALAEDCLNGTGDTWGHQLLRNNAAEVARLREHVRPFIF